MGDDELQEAHLVPARPSLFSACGHVHNACSAHRSALVHQQFDDERLVMLLTEPASPSTMTSNSVPPSVHVNATRLVVRWRTVSDRLNSWAPLAAGRALGRRKSPLSQRPNLECPNWKLDPGSTDQSQRPALNTQSGHCHGGVMTNTSPSS